MTTTHLHVHHKPVLTGLDVVLSAERVYVARVAGQHVAEDPRLHVPVQLVPRSSHLPLDVTIVVPAQPAQLAAVEARALQTERQIKASR
jgi:hypothetical protein